MMIKIKKATGEIADFDESKLLNSLLRSGADPEHAQAVVKEVIRRIKPQMSTRKIYRIAHKFLKGYNKASVLRYSLKEALLKLGPSGYPFEKYVGELLRNNGYDVKVGITLEGKCVSHEVDVYAEKKEEIILIECKYRNSADGSHDVKTALYVHARHQDLRIPIKKEHPDREINGWLVTNTRFTEDAIQYAECSRLKIVSWRYPQKNSLEKMIEKLRLYPITVMSNLNTQQIKTLISNNIILMRDLSRMDPLTISSVLSIGDKKAAAIKHQAEELCGC